eukprot:scaffold37939_cov244-Amphora_coffeaeformis.AAC.4
MTRKGNSHSYSQASRMESQPKTGVIYKNGNKTDCVNIRNKLGAQSTIAMVVGQNYIIGHHVTAMPSAKQTQKGRGITALAKGKNNFERLSDKTKNIKIEAHSLLRSRAPKQN